MFVVAVQDELADAPVVGCVYGPTRSVSNVIDKLLAGGGVLSRVLGASGANSGAATPLVLCLSAITAANVDVFDAKAYGNFKNAVASFANHALADDPRSPEEIEEVRKDVIEERRHEEIRSSPPRLLDCLASSRLWDSSSPPH